MKVKKAAVTDFYGENFPGSRTVTIKGFTPKQASVVQQALDVAEPLAGSDRPAHLLDLICSDFIESGGKPFPPLKGVNTDDQEARRTSQKSRWTVGRSGEGFTIGNGEVGTFDFDKLDISNNSNWVYPHSMKVKGGRINLTDYELAYVMSEYLRYTVTTDLQMSNNSVDFGVIVSTRNRDLMKTEKVGDNAETA